MHIHPTIQLELAKARIAELQRGAERDRVARAARGPARRSRPATVLLAGLAAARWHSAPHPQLPRPVTPPPATPRPTPSPPEAAPPSRSRRHPPATSTGAASITSAAPEPQQTLSRHPSASCLPGRARHNALTAGAWGRERCLEIHEHAPPRSHDRAVVLSGLQVGQADVDRRVLGRVAVVELGRPGLGRLVLLAQASSRCYGCGLRIFGASDNQQHFGTSSSYVQGEGTGLSWSAQTWNNIVDPCQNGAYGTDYHHHQDNGGQIMYFYDDRNTD